MIVRTEETATITLTVTRREAQEILNDFDKSREPSASGKGLYASLAGIVRQDKPDN